MNSQTSETVSETEELLNTIDILQDIAEKALKLLDEYGCESEAAEELHENLKIISDSRQADNPSHSQTT